MCSTCGCSDGAETRLTVFSGDHNIGHSHADDGHHHGDHHHDHSHEGHEHHHDHGEAHGHSHEEKPISRTLQLEQDILAKNNQLAEHNRGWLEGREIAAFNLMSSPGAGKTSLLERTIRELGTEIRICVVEGDQETTLDAQRIGATGCRAVQINTGSGCHLDAAMLSDALKRLKPPAGSVLMIENVGNLVCPALFDLGESAKVVIASVTEGEDKPLKYPYMFRLADLMLLNKIDLLPYVPFDVDRCIAYARQVNPALKVLQLSVLKGDGMEAWYSFLRERKAAQSVSA
jgi:hydrogenase nickel incorporation protein HypB